MPEPNPYQPPVEAPAEEAGAEEAREATVIAGEGPRGIGGWLILPLLGLFGSLVTLTMSLFRDYLPMFTAGGDYAVITDPSFEQYHPLWGPLILFELVTNLSFIALIIYLLYLAIRRSRRFPTIMIGYFAAGIAVALIDEVWGELIPAVANYDDGATRTEIMRSIAGACIWIPYFLRSRRVKNTFIEP